MTTETTEAVTTETVTTVEPKKRYTDYTFASAMAFLEANPDKVLRVESPSIGIDKIRYNPELKRYEYKVLDASDADRYQDIGTSMSYLARSDCRISDEFGVELPDDFKPVVKAFDSSYQKAVRRLSTKLLGRIRDLEDKLDAKDKELSKLIVEFKKRKKNPKPMIVTTENPETDAAVTEPVQVEIPMQAVNGSHADVGSH